MSAISIIVFGPLLAAIIAGLGNRALGNVPAKVITTGLLFLSCALSWPIFLGFLGGSAQAHVEPVFNWIQSGTLDAAWQLRVDTLTAVMLVVVTTVSALVHLYSWGYMEDDPDQPRFFAYLSLFTFAMLMLVTANNLLQLFFGWEGVGLASYLLIGFWYQKPSACAAAIKAFVVNRVGDLGFMMGIFGTYLVFNTLSIPDILAAAPGMASSTIGFLGFRAETMTVLCLLLFLGAMGKSAQIGLHTWLPDAMEGPTPVSALIHAATMVTAGVFMLCRLSPMFEASHVAMTVVTVVGAVTCLFAATIGCVQNDIKRVIAYSTCSQLGYMFFAAGVGAYGAAMFHLLTHAFFKALLFLSAGAVIQAMHHEQDMRYYGGLRKKIPITFWAMMAGTLAITGVGIPGTQFGFAAFFSKDTILEASYAAGGWSGVGAYWFGTIAAMLTAFYSWRVMFLTFWGKPRWTGSEHIQHALHDAHGAAAVNGHDHGHDDHSQHETATGDGGYQPHERGLVMLIPLIVLSLGAVFSGVMFAHAFVSPEGASAFWRPSTLFFDAHLMEAAEHIPQYIKLGPTVLMVVGFAVAWAAYIRFTSWPALFARRFRPIYLFLLNKWYFDELYDLIFVRPAFAFGRLFWKGGDKGIIDRFGPNGLAYLVTVGGRVTRRLQSGYLYSYALVMLIGLAAATTWAIMPK